MVELAIILPLLLLLLFGITELGRALYQQNMLTQGVELGARYLARVEEAVTDDGAGGCNKSDDWSDYQATVENLIKCGVDGVAGCADPLLPNIEIDYIDVCGPSNAHASCNSPSTCLITVKASADFNSIFGGDLVAVPGFRIEGVRLNAATQERFIGH